MKTNDELLQSLIDEHVELQSKLTRLRAFLNDPENMLIIGTEHWGFLSVQQKAMETYAEALFWRIKLVEREIKK